jgi:hypothetical protein
LAKVKTLLAISLTKAQRSRRAQRKRKGGGYRVHKMELVEKVLSHRFQGYSKRKD